MNKQPITQKQREYNKQYFNNKYNENIQFNIRVRMCNRFNNAMRKYSTSDKISTSVDKNINYKVIIEHLKPFPLNIKDYHIDHIIPLGFFDLADEEQVRKAWSPINLQGLKCGGNISKGKDIDFKKYPEQLAVFSKLGLGEYRKV